MSWIRAVVRWLVGSFNRPIDLIRKYKGRKENQRYHHGNSAKVIGAETSDHRSLMLYTYLTDGVTIPLTRLEIALRSATLNRTHYTVLTNSLGGIDQVGEQNYFQENEILSNCRIFFCVIL